MTSKLNCAQRKELFHTAAVFAVEECFSSSSVLVTVSEREDAATFTLSPFTSPPSHIFYPFTRHVSTPLRPFPLATLSLSFIFWSSCLSQSLLCSHLCVCVCVWFIREISEPLHGWVQRPRGSHVPRCTVGRWGHVSHFFPVTIVR